MIDKVLIGSTAMIEQLDSSYPLRKPKDNDYLYNPQTLKTFQKENDYINGQKIFENYEFSGKTATLDEIYTLKVSHSPWVINNLENWMKHLEDIRLLQDQQCHVIEELYEPAYQQWENTHGVKNVSLSKEKEEFFNNSVERFYVHDTVHESVALGSRPAFNLILVDPNGVKTSKKKFTSLSKEQKTRLVFEESMVLSLERDLIPKFEIEGQVPNNLDIIQSYRKQLRLLITQYSKGWFPRWIIEHYFELINPPLNYWELFQDSNKKVRL